MTILVIGGAGYVGSHCFLDLTDNGMPALIYDNLSMGLCQTAGGNGSLIVGDIHDENLLCTTMQKHNVTAVMHLAASINVGESVTAPELYYQNNVSGSLSVLKSMRRAGVNKIIFSSSCSVYGNGAVQPISEASALAPINPYAFSKLVVENILKDFASAYGMQFVSLRYFNAAGADPQVRAGERHTPETHLIPLAVQAALRQRELSIFGTDYPTRDGTCVRDYVHVSDIAQGHRLALKYLQDGGSSDYFNIGSETGFTVKEVVNKCRQVTERTIKTVDLGRRDGDAAELTASASKIRRVLGWSPKFSDLDTIVETAWRWEQNSRQKQSSAMDD